MDRRRFISSSFGVGLGSLISPISASSQENERAQELRADVVIVGGGLGGCAAALGVLRNGYSVIMTEETDWIGGQVSQQGVPPDEHPWIEQFGCTAAYREFRNRIRDYYRRNYPLSIEAQRMANLNPGLGNVSRICHEPRVALAVFDEMLSPYISGKRLTLLLEYEATEASVEGDRVQAVHVRNRRGGSIWLHAPYFIDATELGDLLPMTGTEYITGAESQAQTGEKHAPSEHQPDNIQSSTWCFAMDYLPGEDHTIEKPEQYDFWRDYVPEMTPPWPGKQLSWFYSRPTNLEPFSMICDPVRESENEASGFWRYRRIAYKKHHLPGTYLSDITLVNWPQNDYLLGNFYNVSEEEKEKHFHGAMQHSLSLLYWMQTEAPMPDGSTGMPGLRLRGDILGTEHGLAKYPYIREARRIQAEFTVVEQHVGTEMRMEMTKLPIGDVTSETFQDSVGVGSYRIDLHPSTGGDNYIDISSLPFQIPLGSLIPRRMENLLPACKNLGVTHITNGCYRLHPVEWNIGEAAGLLAARCLAQQEIPRGVRNNNEKLRDFQRWIQAQGVETNWPRVSPR